MPALHWLLSRIILRIDQYGWKIGIGIFMMIFFITWGLMWVFEPHDSPIIEQYWWFYIVTASTVGYGDLTPSSIEGKWIVIVIIFGSISSFSVITAQFVTYLSKIALQIRKGDMMLSLRDHIIIFGYHPGETEQIIQELLADPAYKDSSIALCFSTEQATEHPIADVKNVFAARGELSSAKMIEKSCAADASRVIVHGHDDNETLALCLTIHHVNPQAHMVAALKSTSEYSEKIDMINPAIECVPAGMMTMIVQALQDPGITRLYNRLLSNLSGHEGYRLSLPKDFRSCKFGMLFCFFKQHYNATIIAITASHRFDAVIEENPRWDQLIQSGQDLYYIADQRLTTIDWEKFHEV